MIYYLQNVSGENKFNFCIKRDFCEISVMKHTESGLARLFKFKGFSVLTHTLFDHLF